MAIISTRPINLIIATAERWKNSCLIEDKSLFKEGELWSPQNINLFKNYFSDNLIEGNEDTFYEKLKIQLAESPPEVKQLAAEMIYLILLFPRKIKAETKARDVRLIWSWSGINLDESFPDLDASFEEGVGSTGMAYSSYRWAELVFFTTWLSSLKSLVISERERLLSDPWIFGNWLDKTEGADKRQFRHIVLFLLFPNAYETCSSRNQKNQMISAFVEKIGSGSPLIVSDDSEWIKKDKNILLIREQLTEEAGESINFYLPPYKDMWMPGDKDKNELDDMDEEGENKLNTSNFEIKNSALLVIAFYLSKFGSKSDPKAYANLGFKNASESFSGIAEILEVPKNTVKNYCDTFDPLHGNRKGWHQKQLQPRFKNVADALKNIDEVKLADLCKKILGDEIYRKSEAYLNDLSISNTDDFEDLSQLFLDLQMKAEAFDVEEIDQELPFEFQEKIRSACAGKYEISFSKYSVKLITKDSKNKLLVPNICFFMAIEALPIFNATEVFNEVFKEIYQRLRASGKTTETKPEDLYTEMMKLENASSIKKDFDAAAQIYLKEIGKDSALSLERFNKFINTKKWRLGGNGRDNAGKNPGRTDTSRSAILTALGVPHELMGSIYSLVEEFGKSGDDFSRFSLLSGSYDSSIVDSPRNLIVYGAPGTGKSHYLNNLLKDANTIRTVFHSETQNSDFVGSLKPVTNLEGKVSYQFVAGPFIKAFVSAVKQPSKQIHLIIEEINRANAAAVFGDIFQLLDRDATGRSEYEIQADELLSKYLTDNLDPAFNGLIYIPSNLIINATMNSSDQGVYPLDSAFKRRWSFKYMPIDFQDSPKGAVDLDGRRITWEILAKSVNEI